MENEAENKGAPVIMDTLREDDAVGASFPACFCKMEGGRGGAVMGEGGYK